LRILITSPVFPPDLGGPSVYVPSIGRFLVERGHEVLVLAFCSDPEPRGWPFPVVTISRGVLPLRYLKAFVQVLRLARGCDVVFVHEHLALMHVLAARLTGVPVVMRMMVDGAWEISHRKGWIGGDSIDTFQQKRGYPWQVRLTRSLQRRWWGWARTLIAPSEYLRGIATGTYGVPPEKVVKIHNAYNGPQADEVLETQAEARKRLGLAAGPRFVLTVCRLMVWKRVDGILRALARLPEGCADVHLLVAGDGDMLEPWRALAGRLGLAERVHFLGNRPYRDIPLLMRASELFVLNSEYEGLSHTLLEATALGTPVVATRVCGNPEVIEHERNGLLVPPGDDAALAAAMARLLGDPGLARRFAAAGRARLSEFDRGRTFAAVEGVLAAAAGASAYPSSGERPKPRSGV
jgi:glycosyltransferase involved in cell wall biosynthesis